MVRRCEVLHKIAGGDYPFDYEATLTCQRVANHRGQHYDADRALYWHVADGTPRDAIARSGG